MTRNASSSSGPPRSGDFDLGARIAWLLRTWRTTRDVSLRNLSARLEVAGHPVSAATLSRRESSGARNGVTFAAYEEAFGLPYGAIRVPVDVVCRTFQHAPVDQAPQRPTDTLEEFTAVCAAVTGQTVTGSDWLRFAEHHVHGSYGLPVFEMRTHLDRLVDQMRRSSGSAYVFRYEALALLRCSTYGDVVLDIIRTAVIEPGAQLLGDLMSVVSEHPDNDLLTWCASLLGEESWPLVNGAALAIQNMTTVGGLSERNWKVLIGPYALACNNAVADPAHLRILATTLETLPEATSVAIKSDVKARLPAVRRPSGWGEDRRNRHFTYAETIAVAAARTPADEQMLARLLFDLIFDYRATHSTTAAFLLRASAYARDLQPLLIRAAFEGPEPTIRHGATQALSHLLSPPVPDPRPWLDSPDTVHQGLGLEICAWSSAPIHEATLMRMIRGDDQLARHALFAAGMAQHPLLNSIAEDLSIPLRHRHAARWWQSHAGGPVLD